MIQVSDTHCLLVVMKNTGTTTVTYEWKKIFRGDYISSKKSDGIQRFYCHYPRDMLKPGESKTFIFSFRSEKPGMFNEEWELLTEPNLITPAPLLCLSGMATKADEYVEKRKQINDVFAREVDKMRAKGKQQILESKPASVVSPREEDLASLFNKFNEHLGVTY